MAGGLLMMMKAGGNEGDLEDLVFWCFVVWLVSWVEGGGSQQLTAQRDRETEKGKAVPDGHWPCLLRHLPSTC